MQISTLKTAGGFKERQQTTSGFVLSWAHRGEIILLSFHIIQEHIKTLPIRKVYNWIFRSIIESGFTNGRSILGRDFIDWKNDKQAGINLLILNKTKTTEDKFVFTS